MVRLLALLMISSREFIERPCQVSRLVNALLRAGYPVLKTFSGFIFNYVEIEAKNLAEKFGVALCSVDVEELSGRLLSYPRVGIYSGRGTYIEGRVHADTLRRLGFYDQKWLGDLDIYSGALSHVDVFLVPGGWGVKGPDFIPFGGEGRGILEKFIREGGGYLGTCAGSIYLGKRITAKDLEPELTLGLLDADVVACFRGRGLVKVKVVDAENPVVEGLPEVFPVYHSGGFVLEPYASGNARVAAVFSELYMYEAYPWANVEELEEMLGKAANIVTGELGKGKIVAFSSHPEYQSYLRQETIRFRTGGRKYEVGEEVVRMGYALEANAIFYLSSGKPVKLDQSDLKPSPNSRRKLAKTAADFSGVELLAESAAVEASKLVKFCEENLGDNAPAYLDDYLLTFTTDKPPKWYLERYRDFPNVKEYVMEAVKKLERASGAVNVDGKEVYDLKLWLKRAIDATRYLHSLASGIRQAMELQNAAGSPSKFREKKLKLEECLRTGLMGEAAKLKSELNVDAWINPLKWENTLKDYLDAFRREVFLYLIDLNREVLGLAAKILYSIEKELDDSALTSPTLP